MLNKLKRPYDNQIASIFQKIYIFDCGTIRNRNRFSVWENIYFLCCNRNIHSADENIIVPIILHA